jgi:uncharacterized membrane protein
MPPANVSFMEDAERRTIVEWYNANVYAPWRLAAW